MKAKEPEPLRCTEVEGEIARFWVFSGKKPPYMVDLLANNGVGVCQCTDNRTVCATNIMRHGLKFEPYLDLDGRNKERTVCRHIAHAREAYLTAILQQLALEHEQSQPT